MINKMNYVYAHVEDDQIVYIGEGKWGRAWKADRRKKEHSEWMQSRLPYLDVKILAKEMTRKESKELEKKLIKKFQPKFNIYYTERHAEALRAGWSNDRKRKLALSIRNKLAAKRRRCHTPDATFFTIADAAEFYDISYDKAKSRFYKKNLGWYISDNI